MKRYIFTEDELMNLLAHLNDAHGVESDLKAVEGKVSLIVGEGTMNNTFSGTMEEYDAIMCMTGKKKENGDVLATSQFEGHTMTLAHMVLAQAHEIAERLPNLGMAVALLSMEEKQGSDLFDLLKDAAEHSPEDCADCKHRDECTSPIKEMADAKMN